VTSTRRDRVPRIDRRLLVAFGLSLLVVGGAGVALSGAFDRSPTVRLAGHDAPVLPSSAENPGDIRAYNSPTLVQNPVRPANLAVSSRIDTPFYSCALDVTDNGGASWSQTPIPAPPGQEAKCFAPDVAFSSDGTLYLSFVTLAGNGNSPNALWLSKSSDGGRTLSSPIRVAGRETFQVRLAADPIRPDRVYMTWVQGLVTKNLGYAVPGNPIVAVRSDDGGTNWSRPTQVNSPVLQRAVSPDPVVGRDGTLYVVYMDLGNDDLDYEAADHGLGGPPYAGYYRLVLARSQDGGVHWAESVVNDRITPIVRFIPFEAPFPSVAVDGSGRVYAATEDGRLGDTNVWLWTLNPGTARWSEATRVNQTGINPGSWRYRPKLAVAPHGRLDVLYYDRSADPHNVMNEVSLQSSFDHGRSFTSPVRLSSRPFSSKIGYGAREGIPDLGSRLGLISDDRAALAVWTDTRAGTPATQKQDLADAAIAVRGATRLPGAAKDALRYGGLAAALCGLALIGLVLSDGSARGSLRSAGRECR
jgi:hypothetical protein